MKERPILFSAPMVLALLDGSKTQTRRPVTRLAGFGPVNEFQRSDTSGYVWRFRDRGARWNDIDHRRLIQCSPYGAGGDRLWVREAWRTIGGLTNDRPPREIPEHYPLRFEADGSYLPPHGTFSPGKLRPGMFMPRWASRIDLVVTGVRVEQLMDIGEVDAGAEGVLGWDYKRGVPRWDQPRSTNRDEYQKLWEAINGPGSWAANPWVWVVEFRRIRP